MPEAPRYRIEGFEAIVDVRVETVERIFDQRDPAPFRQRDLDPGLVEYLVGAAQDVLRAEKMRLVFWIDQPCPPGDVINGVHAHFEYEIERATRRRREQVRSALPALVVAAIAVVVLTGLSELVARGVTGTLGAGFTEALLISGWVLMWRPVEVLVYEGIPWRRERRVLRALRGATVDVRTGTP